MVKVSSSPKAAREQVEGTFRCLSGEKYCLLHRVSGVALIPTADFCLGSVAVLRASEEKVCAVFHRLQAEIEHLFPCRTVL